MSIIDLLLSYLLGKLPASQSSQSSSEVLGNYQQVNQVVKWYASTEGERADAKALFYYLSICFHSKVKAEAAQVQKGIVDLVNKHGIKKLVMGAEKENCMKVRKMSSSKASYVAKMHLSSVRSGLSIKGNTFGSEMLLKDLRFRKP